MFVYVIHAIPSWRHMHSIKKRRKKHQQKQPTTLFISIFLARAWNIWSNIIWFPQGFYFKVFVQIGGHYEFDVWNALKIYRSEMKIRRLEFIAIRRQFNVLKENQPATKWLIFSKFESLIVWNLKTINLQLGRLHF